jgi:DNA-binding MarR family transcriptional regulator
VGLDRPKVGCAASNPKLKPAQETHLVELWRAGKHASAELAELFSVARSTVYRAVQRAGEPR